MTSSSRYRRAISLLSGLGFLLASWSASAAESPRPPTLPTNQAPTDHARRPPNAVVQVSARLLSHLLTTDIERTTTLGDDVLGTSVRGTVHTRLQLIPQFVPDSHRGLLQMRFTGTSISPRMVGHNGPATSISSSVSNVEVRKIVIFDEQGVHLQPSVATCQTCLSIDSISARLRFVERISRRQARRTHDATEAMTAEHTRLRVQEEVDQEVVRKLARANERFQEMVRSPWIERDSLPKLCRFSTTSNHLRIELGECGQSQFSAPQNVPGLDERHDFVVTLHESAAQGIYEIVFGRPIANDRDVHLATDSTTPEKARPWRLNVGKSATSIQLAALKPLELSYSKGTATVKLNTTSVESGRQKYQGEFTVFAKYRLEKTAEGPRLHREADLSVEGHSHSGRSDELAEAIRLLRKLSSVIPRNLTLEDLMPPTNSILGKVSTLEVAELDLQDGWLTAGYQLPRSASSESKPTTTRK
jgi:hypothetical protein